VFVHVYHWQNQCQVGGGRKEVRKKSKAGNLTVEMQCGDVVMISKFLWWEVYYWAIGLLAIQVDSNLQQTHDFHQ
jgi:hypothetical protein